MTTVQATDLQKRRTALLKRILKYQDSLASFMPGLNEYLEQQGYIDLTDRPEKMPLYLPSSFPTPIRRRIGPDSVARIEERLRDGQAHEALASLRRHLRIRVVAYKYKSRHVASQRSFMRSRELETSIESKIATATSAYNRAREALLALRGPGEWEKVLQVLKREDIRGLNERTLTAEEKETYQKTRVLAGLTVEPEEGELDDLLNIPTMRVNPSLEIGEGRRMLSWIWYTVSNEELEGNTVHDSGFLF